MNQSNPRESLRERGRKSASRRLIENENDVKRDGPIQ